MYENKMEVTFESKSENEAFARVVVAAFISRLDPTLEQISDIKTAVSEAVTNSIIHGYENKAGLKIHMSCSLDDKNMEIIIKDNGIGIEDIEKAKEPMFTTKPELERSGMGFVFMEVFMDYLEIISKPGEGTTIIMRKNLADDPINEVGE